jgi:serine/threonine protein kinase
VFDGGNNWIHTAVFHGKSVVVKTLKPECQDVALAINEIEGELEIHSRLDHGNIVKLIGAGLTPQGVRFVVLERLDGGTLSQLLGYDNRIRDRRRRFWAKKKISYMDVLKCGRSMADALAYCHGRAIPNVMVLHRDLKPDNVGFTLDGTTKLIDFGLARIVENASVSNEVYKMSGETGSLRYMAPEVADCQPYNQKADVYSFGVMLWELVAFKKPYDGMNREEFYTRVVHGGERPPINKKWPEDLTELIKSCWDADMINRPNFADIVEILDSMLSGEKDGNTKKKRHSKNKFVSGLINRHSTWF